MSNVVRKNYSFLLVLMFLFAAALPCFAGGQSEEQPKTIHVSYVKSPFNLPMMVMKNRGILESNFDKLGISVEYHEINSGAQQAQAMAAGSLDIGGVMNTTSILLARSAGNDIRIVSGFSKPVNIFAIVSGTADIQTVNQLSGKKVGGPKGTVLHQLLAAALEKEGMSMNDVEFIQMGLSQAYTAMLAGQIDASLLAANLIIHAQKEGAAVLATADGLIVPKLVIACRGGFIDAHPDLVDLYLASHREASAWMESHLEEALRMGADEQDISLEEAKQLYEWTRFSDTLDDADIVSMQEDIDFMLENEMLESDISAESCFAESALR